MTAPWASTSDGPCRRGQDVGPELPRGDREEDYETGEPLPWLGEDDVDDVEANDHEADVEEDLGRGALVSEQRLPHLQEDQCC